jgi:hypothetical protein
MDLLRRFLTMTLRENQTCLQLSEARRNQVYMLKHDEMRGMSRELLLA